MTVNKYNDDLHDIVKKTFQCQKLFWLI